VKRLRIRDGAKKIAAIFGVLMTAIIGCVIIVILAKNQIKPHPTAPGLIWSAPAVDAPHEDYPPCTATFTIYSDKIFYGAIPVAEADPESFVTSPSNCITYGKDKNRVYIGYTGVGYQVVPGADPNSFHPLSDVAGLILYSKDTNHVYGAPDLAGLNDSDTHIEQISGADPNTFVALYDSAGYFTGYAEDDHAVYYLLQPLPGADPTTFTVLQGSYNNQFPGAWGYAIPLAKDDAQAYYGPYIVKDADIASFAPVYTPQGFWTTYADDKSHVYCEGPYPHPIILLADADPNTFVAESDLNGGWDGYAHDKSYRWHMCTPTG
jgi:hypothetical protein